MTDFGDNQRKVGTNTSARVCWGLAFLNFFNFHMKISKVWFGSFNLQWQLFNANRQCLTAKSNFWLVKGWLTANVCCLYHHVWWFFTAFCFVKSSIVVGHIPWKHSGDLTFCYGNIGHGECLCYEWFTVLINTDVPWLVNYHLDSRIYKDHHTASMG